MEFSSIQDILEKVKDIEDSLQYDIGSQVSLEVTHGNGKIIQVDDWSSAERYCQTDNSE